jgi:hypothetical protein
MLCVHKCGESSAWVPDAYLQETLDENLRFLDHKVVWLYPAPMMTHRDLSRIVQGKVYLLLSLARRGAVPAALRAVLP